MSVRIDVINLNVNVNGNKAQNELNNLRKKAADIKFEMQGLTKGTKDYIAKNAELKQVTASMDALKKQIGLAALSQKELVRELSTLKALRGSVTPFSDEYKKLSASIKQVEDRLYNVKNGVQGFASFMSKIKDEVKQFGVMAAGYLGFQFITAQFQNMIRGAGKMSDSLADIQRVTGMTAGSVKELNSSLKEIDTRTTTQGLREIAIIAGKLGVASDDILEFTKATDMLVVALGDELGDASQITTELGKILNVFDGEVTGENISKLGNAMVELANAGVASGGFIADFTQRVSAIAKSAGIGLGEVTGLAAALEEMGIRSESGSTAIQKLISTIAADLPKAAKISGVGVQEFTDLFAKAPGEALIKFAEGLSKNKASFAEVSSAFKDAGEEGARVVAVLSTIGQRGEFVREKMQQGAQAIQKTTAITEAFALQNSTLGASLDKLGKEFNRLTASDGFVKFIESATTGLLSFMRALRSIPWPVTTAALTALTLLVIAYTAAKVKAFIATTRQTVAELASATAKKASAIATALLQSAQAFQIITTDLLAKRITILTAVQRAWNVVMSLGAGGIGVLIAAASALVYGIANMVSKTKELTTALKVEAELKSKITDLTGEEEATAHRLFNTLVKGNLGYDEKQKLLKELIAINPEYLSGLTQENIKTKEGLDILDNYILKLREANQVKAKNQLIQEKELRLQQLSNENDALKTKGDIGGNAILDIGAGLGIGKGSSGFQFMQNQQEAEQIKKDLYNLYTSIGEKTKQTVQAVAAGNDGITKASVRTIDTIKDQIKAMDEAYGKIDITDKKGLSGNRSDRNKLQRELDLLEGRKSPADKKFDNQYDKLKADAESFQKELLRLKEEYEIKGREPQQREIDFVEAKSRELTERAKKLYLDQLKDKQKFSDAEVLIEELTQKQINAIIKKYNDEKAALEYDKHITGWQEAMDVRRQATKQDYADGIIDQQQYNSEITAIDIEEKKNLVLIAKDYTGSVKKAVTDLKKFQKDAAKEVTDNAIEEARRRKEFADGEKIAGAELAVFRSKPGSNAELDAQKALLNARFELETENMDKTSNMYLSKQAERDEQTAELEKQSIDRKIDMAIEFASYFQNSLSSLEQIQRNSEQKQLNTEKINNDAKKASFKKQLDGKLISKAQYDRKIEQADAEMEARVKEIQREQAKREKALNIFAAIINTAAGVAKALNNPPPYNFIMAAAVGVAGALQIGAIASQPLPELGTGYWLKTGPKHREAGKGTTVRIERDEAVVSAKAMTDNKRYSVTGTTAQITSALNSRNGGASWATGARVNINPEMPRIMEQGGRFGVGGAGAGSAASADNAEVPNLLKQLIIEQQQTRNDMTSWNRVLKAQVSIKEYREEEELYDNAKKASAL